MRIISGLIVCVLSVGCATTSPYARLDDDRLYGLLAERSLSDAQFDAIRRTAVQTAIATARPAIEAERKRELTHREVETMRRAFDRAFSEVFPRKDWIDLNESLYRKYLSLDEARAVLEFYDSPAGRAFLRVSPLLTAEGARLGEELFAQREEAFLRVFRRILDEELARQKPRSSGEAPRQDSTVADAVQLCRRIQEADELPIGCAFEYVDEKPTIIVVFRDLETANQYWEELADLVAIPFCAAANRANRPAFVLVELRGEQQVRLFACEKGEWSDWFETKRGQAL